MGISTSAAIVVGLPYYEFDPQWLEDNEMTIGRYSPYYDADNEDCIYGMAAYYADGASKIDASKEKINEVHAKFFALTGKNGSLYLMNDVC